MLSIGTTWTITHERPLESGEDPLAAVQRTDPDVLLWAIEEGEVKATVKIMEWRWHPAAERERATLTTYRTNGTTRPMTTVTAAIV